MRAVILAAGYATRLYPLTRNIPKPLLNVAGRSIIDRLVDNLEGIPSLSRVTVVTNARFYDHFARWAAVRNAAGEGATPNDAGASAACAGTAARRTLPVIDVVNDGTTDNDKRLGALGDLRVALDAPGPNGAAAEGSPDEDVLVVAGDNIFDFPLEAFAAFFSAVDGDTICAHELTDVDALRRTGVVTLDADARVSSFAEKPDDPPSTWAVPPLYLYRAETLRDLLPQFLEEGGNGDAPGAFIPWLIERSDVYAYRFEGDRFDIGNHTSYRMVQREFTARRDDGHLRWEEVSRETLFETPIFSMNSTVRRAFDGREATYYFMEPGTWVNIVAVTEDELGRESFVMVRQFRHGTMRVYLEFPGGLVDPGEDAAAAIARELTEETGYVADAIVEIGSTGPNPAIMDNRCITYYTPGCTRVASRDLDENEIIDVELIPVEELIAGVYDDEFDHALMIVALNFYRRYVGR